MDYVLNSEKWIALSSRVRTRIFLDKFRYLSEVIWSRVKSLAVISFGNLSCNPCKQNSKVWRFTAVSKMGEMTGKTSKIPKVSRKSQRSKKILSQEYLPIVSSYFAALNGCKTDSNHPLSNWILKFWGHFFTRLEINLHIPELNCKHKAKKKKLRTKNW